MAQKKADTVYHEFLESPEGRLAWASNLEDDEKTVFIYDTIHRVYVVDGGMTDEEWDEIEGELYESIAAGVS